MRLLVALLLLPALGQAGVVYDLSMRAVSQSSLAFDSSGGPPSTPVVTRYFVENGMVRIGLPALKTSYLFKERVMYVIDNTARLVHVLKRATLGEVPAHYSGSVNQLKMAAANAAPDDRAEAERKVRDMEQVSERMREPVVREYRVTSRFESVDGHACRIWEEHEKDAKRLELCVASHGGRGRGRGLAQGHENHEPISAGLEFCVRRGVRAFRVVDGHRTARRRPASDP